MIAFVTGGTGFVGGHLCERLRGEGWTVRALVRDRRRARRLSSCGCKLVRGDLFDRAAMAKAIFGADLVVHLAGLTKTPRTGEFFRVNGEGTASVVLAALDAEFRGRFIHVSSQAAVGPAINGRSRTESDPPAPVSNYGRSKLLGEQRVRTLGKELNATILRPGAIYGPGEKDIFEQIRAMARTGLAIMPGKSFDVQLTHVDDVEQAILLAAETQETAGRDYMVTHPAIVSTGQVTDAIASALRRRVRTIAVPMWMAWTMASASDAVSRALGRSVSALTRDKMRELSHAPWLAKSTRLAEDTGWTARWELHSGLVRTIDWYRENGWL